MVGEERQDTCKGDSGGPLITEELDGTFTLVGILSGGGLDCSQLGNSSYNWQNKTAKWMRVGAFNNYIESVIFQETLDVDGEWSSWSSWSACKDCGGTQDR